MGGEARRDATDLKSVTDKFTTWVQFPSRTLRKKNLPGQARFAKPLDRIIPVMDHDHFLPLGNIAQAVEQETENLPALVRVQLFPQKGPVANTGFGAVLQKLFNVYSIYTRPSGGNASGLATSPENWDTA